MPYAHATVLCQATAAAVAAGVRAVALEAAGGQTATDVLVVDATLGGGGHSEAILRATADAPHVHVLGIDRDPAAIEAASQRLLGFGPRFSAVHGCFSELPSLTGGRPVAAVLADLGVSSPQFDQPERGFSFRGDGPLDMRMDPSQGPTAADKLASVRLEDLADVLFEYGDIRRSIGTARIVLDEFQKGATTAGKLADRLAARLDRSRSLHPATHVFQALRIWVNDEIGQLESLLAAVPALLVPGGAFAVITFHSGEDRLVKHTFAELARGQHFDLPNRRGEVATAAEVASNPRARSARLRVLTRASANVGPSPAKSKKWRVKNDNDDEELEENQRKLDTI
ncbi:MAG: 16S rRNA (cytosine(1402)-N(4))-methyltransferase RsmH [Myxococcales bacterium]|nr:16S rRNA (cytosine(1402)-N(4))-methyltransferase RsmH [Myxococcales bacterium]